ncbi:hypothetical protein BWK60_11430 [Flavobacterium covae]|nr:hypothetical protein BWK60_11430 [Flavobacterium covae]
MRSIILITSIFIFISCRSQIKSNTEINNMKKFDVNQYIDLPTDDITGMQIQKNGDMIQYFPNNNGYILKIKKQNKPSTQTFVYNDKLNLVAEGNDFYNFPINSIKEYDETGKLIKETNLDLPYKFSIEDLEKKMKTQYDVDIYNVKQIHSMNRYEEKKHLNIPLYEIWTNHKTNTLKFTCYIINGTTGETVYVGERFIEGKQGSLLDQYLNSKKN